MIIHRRLDRGVYAHWDKKSGQVRLTKDTDDGTIEIELSPAAQIELVKLFEDIVEQKT
jgi:hypothetical protein